MHKNARSVPASRELLFKRVSEQGWSVRAASEAAGMSDRRCREWIRRAGGEEPLTDRSSRPHTTSAISLKSRNQVLDLRRERRTMRQVARIAGVGLATVARVCKAEGLSRLKSLEPQPPPIRFEREEPGELLHIDTKRLGRFDRPGHRVTRKRSVGSPKRGFEFIFVANRRSHPPLVRAHPSRRTGRSRLPLPAPGRGLARANKRQDRSGPHRQRLSVSTTRVSRTLHHARHQAEVHPALHPQNQWQGRANDQTLLRE